LVCYTESVITTLFQIPNFQAALAEIIGNMMSNENKHEIISIKQQPTTFGFAIQSV
jgi:hypothetical protein